MTALDRIFTPLLPGAHWRDRMVAVAGSLTGIALTAWIGSFLAGSPQSALLLVAPMGASAVLLYAVPSSPLAQPWPIVGGSVVSALTGVATAHWLGHGVLAAGVGVSVAILAMSVLRCLHPPGGACGLLAVLGGPDILAHGYAYALIPVGLNAITLVAMGIAFHRISGHSYPHRPVKAAPTPEAAKLLAADIDAAIEEMGETFDISREDLEALLASAERHAEARRRRKS
ncbi:HPP family protein [Sphingomonas sp. G-3-2-10]|uniref:HPP family protein n=1 Tax=Sphingomonas sp. G-3-2-10 TaxID=2728838 RepID=UPI0032168916